MNITRRLAIQLLGGAASAWLFSTRTAQAGGLLEGAQALIQSAAGTAKETTYRADASILLMGIPIYTRESAGGGFASLREARLSGRDVLVLRFSAGSYPQRARGLNRLGLFQETVACSQGRPEQAAYFGFVTSSPEESIEAGEAALDSGGKAKAAYEAIEGSISDGWEASRRADFEVPSEYDWDRIGQLEGLIRDSLENGPAVKDESQRRPGRPNTFLHTVLQSAWKSDERTKADYCYNGKRYRLLAERRSDPRTGQKLLDEGLAVDPHKIVLLQGQILNLDEGGKTSFRLWLAEGAERSLPIRFEYKPRGFLRISFVADAAGGVRT